MSLDIRGDFLYIEPETFIERNILDLTPYPNVKRCNCTSNSLIKIICHKNLEELTCFSNKLTEIVIPEDSVLQILDCGHNQLTKIKYPKFLQILRCAGNKIKEIECGESLKELVCNDNQLTKIKLNKSLQKLYCYSNNLTQIECNESLEMLFCFDNKLRKIVCSWDSLKRLDCEKNPLLTIIECFHKINKYNIDITSKILGNTISRMFLKINNNTIIDEYYKKNPDVLEEDIKFINNLTKYDESFDYMRRFKENI